MKRILLGALAGVLLWWAAAFAERDFEVSLECGQAFSPSKGEKVKITATSKGCGTVTIFGPEGRLVKVLGNFLAGPFNASRIYEWDGKDMHGQAVPPGRYTVHLEGNSLGPLHGWGWGYRKRDIISLYDRHGIFDGKDASYFFQSEVAFNETPYAQDCGVRDRVMRRFDFDGNPLGEMIYINGASSAMSLSFCTDIHNNIYIPGYRHFMDCLPNTLCKYDGNTGRLIWEIKTSLPEGVDTSDWKELGKSNANRKEIIADCSVTMLKTDDKFYVSGHPTASNFYLDGWDMVPVYTFDAKSGKFLDRIALDKSEASSPYGVRKTNYTNSYIRLTPFGDFIGPYDGYGWCNTGRWDKAGRLLWGITPYKDIDGDGWRLSPPRPEWSNWGESIMVGYTAHDSTPMSTDIQGNSYYGISGGEFCIGEIYKGTGMERGRASGIMKYDALGQFLHCTHAGFDGGEIDVSVDGRKSLLIGGSVYAAVYGLDQAEATVVVEPEQVKKDAPTQEASQPEFVLNPKTAADFYNKSLWLGAKKDYQQAHRLMEQALAMSKDEDLTSCILCYDGRFYEREKKYQEAIAKYRAWADAKKSERSMALFNVVDCYKKMEDSTAVETTYQDIIKTAGDKFWKGKGYLELARWYRDVKRPDDALKMYLEVINKFPHLKPNGLMESAWILQARKEWAKAEEYLKELIQYYPLYSETAVKTLEEVYKGQNKPVDFPQATLEGTPGKRGDLVADVVLGQADFTGAKYFHYKRRADDIADQWGGEPRSTAYPMGLFSDGKKFYACEHGHGWLRIYDIETLTKNYDIMPQVIVGCRFKDKEKTQLLPGWCSAHGRVGILNTYRQDEKDCWKNDYGVMPYSATAGGNKLYVADHFGNRVLVYDPLPTESAPIPSAVLGQPDFKTAVQNFAGLNASSMAIPVGVYTDGRRLFVADAGNHRVLIWNSLPTQNGQPADVVLGQKSFAENERNSGGVSASSLNRPAWVCTHEGKLVVSDTCNHRVLIWNNIPEKNFAAADIVLGQPDFTTPGVWNMFDSGRVDAGNFAFPNQVYSDGKSLYVADSWNNRVMIWDKFPAKNNQPADRFIGWPDMREFKVVKPDVWTMGNPRYPFYAAPFPGKENAATLNYPIGVCADEKNIYVSDFERSRILIYWK